jgi:hypothetical protein
VTFLGTYTFTVTASAGGCSGSKTYSITFVCPTVTLLPSTLPNGQAGVAYSQTISVSPAGSYTFSLALGSMPSGLTLNPTTGVISGFPLTTGNYTFVVKALGAGGCFGTQLYTLTIACPTIVVNPSVPLAAGDNWSRLQRGVLSVTSWRRIHLRGDCGCDTDRT